MILDQIKFGRFVIKVCDHDKIAHKYYVNLYCVDQLIQSIEADSLEKAINIRLAVMITAKNVLAMVRDFAKE